MTAFWQGERPWSAFEPTPAWDRAADATRVAEREQQHRPSPPGTDVPRDVEFVQQAIQQSYER